MDRDRRLTGFLRGQTDKVVAPEGFELNNPWRVRIHASTYDAKPLMRLGGETDSLKTHKCLYYPRNPLVIMRLICYEIDTCKA